MNKIANYLKTSYANDPHWITAKFGQCSECHKDQKGKRVLFYPKDKKIYCEKCGEKHWHDFKSHAADEDVYHGYGNPYSR